MLKEGEKEIAVLYQEADGIMIYTQGKDRKEQYNNYKKAHPDEEVPKKVRNIELKYKYNGEYEEIKKLEALEKYCNKRRNQMKRYNEDEKIKIRLKEILKDKPISELIYR